MKLSFRKILDEEELTKGINQLYKEYVGRTYKDENYKSYRIYDISLIKKGKTYYWCVVASPVSDISDLVNRLIKYTVLITELLNGTYQLEEKGM